MSDEPINDSSLDRLQLAFDLLNKAGVKTPALKKPTAQKEVPEEEIEPTEMFPVAEEIITPPPTPVEIAPTDVQPSPPIVTEPPALVAQVVQKTETPKPKSPEFPTLDLSLWQFKPKLLTNDKLVEREQQLIEAVRPFLAQALVYNPPCNQFQCSLVLGDHGETNNFPIRFILRSAHGDTQEFYVSSHTENLDEAIELKKAIQSHILNHPSIIPLRLHKVGESERADDNNDTFMPNRQPDKMELINYGDFYAASFLFQGDSPKDTQQIVIPLGIKYEPRAMVIAQEAKARLDHLEEHIYDLIFNDRWETLGEVVQNLKYAVKETGKSSLNVEFTQGWQIDEKKNLEIPYFNRLKAETDNPHGISVDFPAKKHQSTFIKNAYLRLEGGIKNPNPIWRLMLTFDVVGLDFTKPQEAMHYQASMNLHTADETAAQIRAHEALESLINNFKKMRTEYPDTEWYWKGVTNGELILREADTKVIPRDPHPQTLDHFIEDMPNPKQNFQVAIKHQPIIDGKKMLTLCLQRGSKSENDFIEFKEKSGKPILRTFEIINDDEKTIKALVKEISDLFKKALNETYGNRAINKYNDEGERIRKTRQKFDPATVRNLFDHAIRDHVKDVEITEGKTAADYRERNTDTFVARNS